MKRHLGKLSLAAKSAFFTSGLVSALAASSSAFAHGSLAHQSHEAVGKAVELFQATQPNEVKRAFKSIAAELTGHEMFHVVIGLQDGKTLGYECRENEDVDPVVWECKAQ